METPRRGFSRPSTSSVSQTASTAEDLKRLARSNRDRLTGPWFFEHRADIGFEFFGGAVVWDSSLLFGPDAAWADVPRPLEHFGYTVIASSDGLQDHLQQMWAVSD